MSSLLSTISSALSFVTAYFSETKDENVSDGEDGDIEEQKNNHSSVTYCKLNCGRSVQRGATTNDNPIDTCCSGCILNNHTSLCNNNNDNNADKLSELYQMDDNRYCSSLIYEIQSKINWEIKIYNTSILEKWKKQSIQYGMPLNEFDLTIKILKEMINRDKFNAKIDNNSFYSSDDDGDDDDPLTDYNIIQINEDKLINKDIGNKLRLYINNNIESSLNNNNLDWHPGSNKQVLDLVHPSLYCYVKNESILIQTSLNKFNKIKQQTNVLTSSFTQKLNSFTSYFSSASNQNIPTLNERNKYQWLPSEFYIERDINDNNVRNVNILSYINNLDEILHSKLYHMIGKIFGKMVPLFDKILNKKLANNCQVIVKLSNIVLSANSNSEYMGGSWHIEGMPYEHIAATGVYYYDIHNIYGSYLQFRQSIDDQDIEYNQNDAAGVWQNYKIKDNDPLNKYITKLPINKEKIIIFPNIYQHRVTKFKLKDSTKPGRRKILVFFVIDPKYCILSTKNVPFQQKYIMKNYLYHILKQSNSGIQDVANVIVEYMDTFTEKQARQNREKLMFVRKFIVKEENKEIYERPFSLCEH